MPHYLKDIQQTIRPDDMAAIIARATSPRDRAILILLYLTGCRSIEATMLNKKDIKQAGPELYTITLHTAKLKKTEGYEVKDRILELNAGTPYLQELLDYAAAFPEGADLFPICPTRIKQIVYTCSENKYCPYHFRHSRFTRLAEQSATWEEIAKWKGAADIRSVKPYLRAQPIGRKFTID